MCCYTKPKFFKSENKTASAWRLGTVGDIFARARKGFMTKMVWTARCRDIIDLIAGTYVKSLKAALVLNHINYYLFLVHNEKEKTTF